MEVCCYILLNINVHDVCVREKESWVEVVGGLGHAIGS